MNEAPLTRFAAYLGTLRPESLDQLPLYYLDNVEFRDPINEGRNLADLRAIFEDFFKQLKEVHVDITTTHGDDQQGFLRWAITYKFRGKPRRLDGISQVTFAADGRVATQHDFWDPSTSVYGEFPGLGLVLRLLQRIVRVRPK